MDNETRIIELEAALAAKTAECERMRDELETERMRLAACGAAALGYFDGCHDTYKSASLSDVLALYARAEKDKSALAEKTAECERMQAENEQLSAGVCTNLIGDERGNPTCAAREQLAVLTLEYEDRLAELEAALAENTRLQAALRRHGVAIVYGDRDVGMNALRARIAELEAALATRTAELEEVSVEYQTLIEDIDEYLPEYQMDRADGEFDEANERERIEYAAAELEDLRSALAEKTTECDRLKVENERHYSAFVRACTEIAEFINRWNDDKREDLNLKRMTSADIVPVFLDDAVVAVTLREYDVELEAAAGVSTAGGGRKGG